MKKYKNIIFASIIFLISLFVFLLSFYRFELSPVSTSNEDKVITVESGSTVNSIAKMLKKNNLIRSKNAFKIYARLNNKNNLQAGTYKLSESMSTKQIISVIEEGKIYNKDEIKITFKEGKNIRYIAKTIALNTINNESDVYALVKDNDYLNELIEKYWFINSEIKQQNIYYSLEGYLFPETYYFDNKNVTVKEIFTSMLDEMDKRITPLKEDIEKSKLSIHELLTLSSIVELEGASANDRKEVAGVFYNRLNNKWTLGSDVTTYYASRIDDWSTSLTYKELDDCSNWYNTRCKTYIGLPVGPIANSSLESIEAVIHPKEHDYFYFVADCKGEVYLTKNETEHINIINKLKRDDNWCA